MTGCALKLEAAESYRRSVSYEHRKSLLVSSEAIWVGVGTALLVAGLDFFSYLARCARDRRRRIDAGAASHIHLCTGGYGGHFGCSLLYQG
jgi:hypothetical protein